MEGVRTVVRGLFNRGRRSMTRWKVSTRRCRPPSSCRACTARRRRHRHIVPRRGHIGSHWTRLIIIISSSCWQRRRRVATHRQLGMQRACGTGPPLDARGPAGGGGSGGGAPFSYAPPPRRATRRHQRCPSPAMGPITRESTGVGTGVRRCSRTLRSRSHAPARRAIGIRQPTQRGGYPRPRTAGSAAGRRPGARRVAAGWRVRTAAAAWWCARRAPEPPCISIRISSTSTAAAPPRHTTPSCGLARATRSQSSDSAAAVQARGPL